MIWLRSRLMRLPMYPNKATIQAGYGKANLMLRLIFCRALMTMESDARLMSGFKLPMCL